MEKRMFNTYNNTTTYEVNLPSQSGPNEKIHKTHTWVPKDIQIDRASGFSFSQSQVTGYTVKSYMCADCGKVTSDPFKGERKNNGK